MSDSERLFRHLVRTIEEKYPAYVTRPFDVGELYQTILPYRHHRRELGFETNQDYEMALTELLSGAGGYLVVEERLRDRLQRELASPNPDPGAFREFPTAQVSLDPEAVAKVAGSAGPKRASVPSTPAPRAFTPTPAAAPVAQRMSTPTATAGRPAAGVTPAAGESCRYCGGALPTGRRITFCPHCGQNLMVVNCAACGAELELGWKFCPTCGRPAAATAGA